MQRRQWHPNPALLPGKSHEWRSLVGCHLWGCTESDTTEVTQQSLCIIGSRLIHLIRTDSNVFLFIVEQYSILYMYHNLLTHSSVNEYLGCFHVLAIVKSASVNTGICVSFSILVSSGEQLLKMEVESNLQCFANFSCTAKWFSYTSVYVFLHILFCQGQDKDMATQSSILAWRIPWTEELGGLQFTGSHRVGHD